MFLSTAVKYISLTWHIKKLTFAAALEYRLSFFAEVIGMFINDAALIIIWILFFNKFTAVKGWSLEDTLLTLSLVWLSFSLVTLVGQGIFELAQLVTKGELDHYITSPHNIVWYIAISKSNLSDLGTVILTLAMAWYVLPGTVFHWTLFITLSVVVALIVFSYVLIIQSLAFYTKESEKLADYLLVSLLYIIYFPQTVFSQPLRIITKTLLPAFFLTTLPVTLIKEFQFPQFFALVLFTGAYFYLALVIFKKGLKRYESGNLVTVKL